MNRPTTTAWMRRATTGAALTVLATVLLLGLGAPAQAAIPAGNLVQNGDAESGTGAGAGDNSTTSPVPIPGWTTTTNFTEHAYDPSGNFPAPAVSAEFGGGNQFFAGGPHASDDNATETATQDVDLSAAATEIDAGGVSAKLSAAMGGFLAQEDNATVAATFLGADGTTLGQLQVGPISASDRGGATTLLSGSDAARVPVGARTARVLITTRRLEGTYNDGYVDNVALTLAAVPSPPPPPPPPPPPVTGPEGNPLGLPTPKPHSCVDRRKLSFRLHHARGTRIVKAKGLVNGKRAVVKRGHKIKRLVLKRLPKGRFVVRVIAVDNSGAKFISEQTYQGCKAHKPKHHGKHGHGHGHGHSGHGHGHSHGHGRSGHGSREHGRHDHARPTRGERRS